MQHIEVFRGYFLHAGIYADFHFGDVKAGQMDIDYFGQFE